MNIETKKFRAKISPQGQVSLPKEARVLLQAEKGSYVNIVVRSDGLYIDNEVPVTKFFGKVNVLSGTDPEKFHCEYKSKIKDRIL